MEELLKDAVVRATLRQAWIDSEPGISGGHEEGGFLCRAADGGWAVDRWPRGERSQVYPPPHPGGQRNGEVIVATFHTHPNTGSSWYQEPSPGDCRGVAEDPDLKYPEYVGEIVVSQKFLYLISPNGNAHIIAETAILF